MNDDKEILITGCHGQLGSELRAILGDSAVYVDKDTLDLSDAAAVADFMAAHDFRYVVNCAAYTAVDRAEDDKLECARANIDAVKNLATHADRLGYRLVHISTDYVFPGTANIPYRESDRTEPLQVYGTTKRKGETALIGLNPECMIIRTGWLYSQYGHNFVKTIMAKLNQGSTLRVVDDQIGTPTNAADLAAFIADKALRGHWTPGIFHYSGEGVASWYDFAKAIARLSGHDDAHIIPIHSADYPTAASRPVYSVLDKSKVKATFGIDIPYWYNSLALCIEKINSQTHDQPQR